VQLASKTAVLKLDAGVGRRVRPSLRSTLRILLVDGGQATLAIRPQSLGACPKIANEWQESCVRKAMDAAGRLVWHVLCSNFDH